MRWVEALQAATRPIVTLALVGALVYGFVTTLVNAEGVLSVVGMGVTFWFSQRQMGRAGGARPPPGGPCEAKRLDAATCASLDAARKEAARVERSVRRALVAPPSNDLDMEQLMEYLGVVMQLGAKAAL